MVAPGFSVARSAANGWAGSDVSGPAAISGIFAAIPFAIWFFLAIKGAAMAAEEDKDPRRTIPRACIAGILTLVILALGVMVFAGGVGDWRQLSIILGYSRQFFALARAGFLPHGLAKLSRFRTPHRAILAGGVIGIAAICSDSVVQA